VAQKKCQLGKKPTRKGEAPSFGTGNERSRSGAVKKKSERGGRKANAAHGLGVELEPVEGSKAKNHSRITVKNQRLNYEVSLIGRGEKKGRASRKEEQCPGAQKGGKDRDKKLGNQECNGAPSI